MLWFEGLCAHSMAPWVLFCLVALRAEICACCARCLALFFPLPPTHLARHAANQGIDSISALSSSQSARRALRGAPGESPVAAACTLPPTSWEGRCPAAPLRSAARHAANQGIDSISALSSSQSARRALRGAPGESPVAAACTLPPTSREGRRPAAPLRSAARHAANQGIDSISALSSSQSGL